MTKRYMDWDELFSGKEKVEKSNDPEDCVIKFSCKKLGEWISCIFNNGKPITYADAAQMTLPFSSSLMNWFEGECRIKSEYTFNELEHFTSAIYQCEKKERSRFMKEVTVPSSWETVPNLCFNGCVNVRKVNLSNRIYKIGDMAFYNCQHLREIYIPDSVLEMGISCFAYCTELNKVRLSNKIETIPEYCFKECFRALRNIDLPASVKGVDEHAFDSAVALKNFRIHSKIYFDPTSFYVKTDSEGYEYKHFHFNAYVPRETYSHYHNFCRTLANASYKIIPY